MDDRIARIEKNIEHSTEDWHDSLNSMECDKEGTEFLILESYNMLGLPKPRIVWVPNPWVVSEIVNTATKPMERITMRKILKYHFSDLHDAIRHRELSQLFMSLVDQSAIRRKDIGRLAEEVLQRKIVRHCHTPLTVHRRLRLKAWYRWADPCLTSSLLVDNITHLVKHNPYVAFVDDLAIVSEKHFDCNYNNADNRLSPHCLRKPAISFKGAEVYALFGRQIAKKYAFPESLTMSDVMNIKNVNTRAFMVGEVGISKVLDDDRIVYVEKKGNYSLIDVGIVVDEYYAPYLVMKNPSTGEIHIEGVDEECRTIQQANNWRANGNAHKSWRPSQLT